MTCLIACLMTSLMASGPRIGLPDCGGAWVPP